MKIAVVGAGVAGSYLLNRLDGHRVECFEMRPQDKWYTVCAWGTSEPYISEMVKKAGFNFEDYVLHRGSKMTVDAGDQSFDLNLRGLVSYDKHKLCEDMLKGHVVHWGAQVKDLDGKLKDFDIVVDATGMHRALLPKVKNDMLVPCLEYQVRSKKLPWNDFYIKPYPGLCVAGDSLVMTNPGAKPIAEVVANEPVLTKSGWSAVKQVYKREYSGEIVEITPFLCGFPVGLTPDHLVWVWDRKTDATGWKPAKEVRECHSKSIGDYVGVPVPRHNPVSSIVVSHLCDGVVKDGRIYPQGRNQFGATFAYRHAIKNEIQVTDELAEFFGYYISEGSAFNNGIIVSNTRAAVLRRMKELGEGVFGLPGHEYVAGQVQFNSTILRGLFINLFGEGVLNKRIPLIGFGFPDSAKVALIRGLLTEDGCKESRKSNYDYLSYTTASRMLALGLWQLLLNLGVMSSVSYSRASKSYRIRAHGEQLLKLGDLLGTLKLTKKSTISRKYVVRDGMAYIAVRKVRKREMNRGFVYDLETNGSFTTSFLVHNSGYLWFFPLWDGTGHLGAGDLHGAYRGEIEAMLKKYDCEVIRKIGRPVRIMPPAYCQPFSQGKVVGVGESIGTVFPMLGEGIIPSMQCAEIFIRNMDDVEAYAAEVIRETEMYTKAYGFIKSKMNGNFSMMRSFPGLLSLYHFMQGNEKRFGMQTKLADLVKLAKL